MMRQTPRLLVGLAMMIAELGTELPVLSAQDPLREVAQERRLREFLAVVNSNDPTMLTEFLDQETAAPFRNFAPIERHVELLLDLHRRSGQLACFGPMEQSEQASVQSASYLVRKELPQSWSRFTLEVEGAPPNRITHLSMAPSAPPPGHELASDLTDEDIALAAEAFVRRLVAADVFSGAVLLAKDDEILYRGAYGEASKRFAADNRVDTRFYTASITKTVTATAVMLLVDRGQLSLEEALSGHVSEEWLATDVADGIQVRHLLSHTSGLADWDWESSNSVAPSSFRGLDAYQLVVPREPVGSPPGTRFSYSNSGYLLLGAVIESVTGQSYYDFVRDNVLRPAGMTSTDYFEMDRGVKNIATGYRWELRGDGLEYTNNTFEVPALSHPAGGLYSTVDDLYRFGRALREGKLVTPETLEVMWNPRPELGSPDYGFGFSIGGAPGDRIIGHSGGFAGVATNLDLFVDSGYTVVVLSNYQRSKWPIVFKLRDLIGHRRERE